MEIATIVSTHANPQITEDTVDSVKTWITDKVMLLVDQAGWSQFQDRNICNVDKIEGFYHNYYKGCYRNYALGLKTLFETYPNADWYWWLEYDALVISDAFKADLEKANKQGIWMMACDLRKYKFAFPLLEEILGCGKIQTSRYLLGCCQFHHHNFLAKLTELDFFNKLIDATEEYREGIFPDYPRHAFEEELWPTLALHLGGRLKGLSCWINPRWVGSPLYKVRYQPEIRPYEILPSTSIIHPVKNPNPIRLYYRKQRDKIRKFKNNE